MLKKKQTNKKEQKRKYVGNSHFGNSKEHSLVKLQALVQLMLKLIAEMIITGILNFLYKVIKL